MRNSNEIHGNCTSIWILWIYVDGSLRIFLIKNILTLFITLLTWSQNIFIYIYFILVCFNCMFNHVMWCLLIGIIQMRDVLL